MYRDGFVLKDIHAALHKEGIPEDIVAESLCRLKLSIYKKRKSKGVFIMAIGAVLLILGFVLTVFLFHADHEFDTVMYGCTMAGTALLCWGGYEILQ